MATLVNYLFYQPIAQLLRLALVLMLIGGLFACNETPDVDSKTKVAITPQEDIQYPETDAGKAIESHIQFLVAIGPNAELNYQNSLQGLRTNAAESIPAIVATYEKTEKSSYNERAYLVETLTALRLEQALEPLISIAEEALPQRIPLPDDTESALNQELIIRMTAIRGLGHIAQDNDIAVQKLSALADHAELPIHEQARESLALVIAQEKDEKRLQQLLKLFPGKYEHWLPLTGLAPPVPTMQGTQ